MIHHLIVILGLVNQVLFRQNVNLTEQPSTTLMLKALSCMSLMELAYLVKEKRARLGDSSTDCDFRPRKSGLIFSIWQNVNLTEQPSTTLMLKAISCMILWELAYLVKEIRARLSDPSADCDFRPHKSGLIFSIWQNVNLTEQPSTTLMLKALSCMRLLELAYLGGGVGTRLGDP